MWSPPRGCLVVASLCLSTLAWAGDDLATTLKEERAVSSSSLSSALSNDSQNASSVPVVPKAENVDLKEVISEPLHEVLPVPKETEVEAEPQVQQAQKTSSSTQSKGDEKGVEKNDDGEPPAPTGSVGSPVKGEVQGSQPLILLGAEVPPGTTTRLAWSAKDSLAGISIPTPVLVAHGVKPGPTVCLTAAVHGDELNGIEVVRQVLYDLKPEKLHGTVIGVPIVNLQGFHRASRYLTDRRDLNRYFPGYANGSSAARIAHSFFTQVIQHCTYLVDLHTGSFRRTNLPQLRADLNHPKVAEMTHNLGPIVVLQSRGAKGSLRRAAVEAGIPAVTVEAGEPLHVDQEAVKQGVRSVENFLHRMDVYAQKGLWARKTEPVYYKSRWVRTGSGGILRSDILLGERVSAGQVLGAVIDPITNATTEIPSPIDGQVIGMALNQVMFPGYAAYHIGFQATVEEAASQDVGPDDSAGDDAELGDAEEPEADGAHP